MTFYDGIKEAERSGNRFLPEAEDMKKRFHRFDLRSHQQHDQVHQSVDRKDRRFR